MRTDKEVNELLFPKGMPMCSTPGCDTRLVLEQSVFLDDDGFLCKQCALKRRGERVRMAQAKRGEG